LQHRKLKNFLFFVAALMLSAALREVCAQQTSTKSQPAARVSEKEYVRRTAPRAIVVVINRLSGTRLLAWLHRSGVDTSTLDDQTLLTTDLHISIVAGFYMKDGQHIVARLPPAEAEVAAIRVSQRASAIAANSNEAGTSSLKILREGAPPLDAQYLGLDAGTGLSVLRINETQLPSLTRETSENALLVNQRVRLFAPAPASNEKNSVNVSGVLPLRIAEVEGRLAEILRAPGSATIASLIVRLDKFAPSLAGGIALSDTNEIIGVVEAVEPDKAFIMPVGVVRRAAEKVLARSGNVPAPLLGVQGESVATIISEQHLLRGGWTSAEASELLKKRTGVLLTSIAAGTPAAHAGLQPGDIILRANNAEVRNAKDFSQLLRSVGSGAQVHLTFMRARQALRDVTVILSESLNPLRAMRESLNSSNGFSSLLSSGLETMALSPRLAAHFGAHGGRLIIYVQPQSAAFRAGFRPDDIIESVNNQKLYANNERVFQTPNSSAMPVSLTIVRDNQRLVMTLPVQQTAPLP
jgi:S1-C subfamily serine protease